MLRKAHRRHERPPPLADRTPSPSPPHVPPSVVILGVVPHATVMTAWRRCLVGVGPSVELVAERPVLAARSGGNPELEADVTGILVPPGDAHTLAEALQRLLADHELPGRLGEEALRRCDKFRASAVAPRIEEVYWEVAA
jgi:Glycosyl transferases group 1